MEKSLNKIDMKYCNTKYRTFCLSIIVFGFFSINMVIAQQTNFEDLRHREPSNNEEITVFMKVNLDGEIRNVLYYNAIFDRNGSIVEEKKLDFYYFFNKVYKGTEKNPRRINNVYEKTTYIYKGGRLYKSKTINDESLDGVSEKFEYNDLGQKSVRYYYSNPVFRDPPSLEFRYFYKDNILSKFQTIDSDEKDIDGSWTEYNKVGKELKSWKNGKLDVINYYVKDSILVKRVYNLNRGEKYLPKEVTYIYDSNNNIIERNVFNFNKKNLEDKKLYKYDSRNNLIEEKKVVGDLSESKYTSDHKKYEYNQNNKLIVEKWFDTKGKMKFYFYAKEK